MCSLKFTLFVCLLATSYMLPLSAQPTDLVAKLAKLTLEPENDVRFNEIDAIVNDIIQKIPRSSVHERFETLTGNAAATAATAVEANVPKVGEAEDFQIERQAQTVFSTMVDIMGSILKMHLFH